MASAALLPDADSDPIRCLHSRNPVCCSSHYILLLAVRDWPNSARLLDLRVHQLVQLVGGWWLSKGSILGYLPGAGRGRQTDNCASSDTAHHSYSKSCAPGFKFDESSKTCSSVRVCCKTFVFLPSGALPRHTECANLTLSARQCGVGRTPSECRVYFRGGCMW